MRIITYPNPHEIRKNQALMKLFEELPQFCASDTLKQGLEHSYGREAFGDVLYSVDSLVEAFLGSTINNIELNIQLFLNVASEIRKLSEPELKKSFRFNIYDVVDSVKLLNILNADENLFSNHITEEQASLLKIYQNSSGKSIFRDFELIRNYNLEECEAIIRKTLLEEIEYYIKSLKEVQTEIDYFILNSFVDAQNLLNEVLSFFNKREKEFEVDPFADIPDSSRDKNKIRHFLKILSSYDKKSINRIIVHGVHRFTPEIHFVIKLLENAGIEIIFVINYAQNIPNTYGTWKKVYEWTGCEFEFVKDLDLNQGKEIGRNIADIIEGKEWKGSTDEEAIVYPHLTSFTDREVKRDFQNGKILSKMKTQFYAVDGNNSNEILKMYFPEQFKQKPFLSYPIGQFILGLYNMWDFENNRLEINSTYLSECAVSRVYSSELNTNILTTITKIKQYYSDLKYLEHFNERTEQLINALDVIEKNQYYKPLSKLSYFNISRDSLLDFKGFLKFIGEIAAKLFVNNTKEIDFGDHFQTLIEILKVPTQNRSNTSIAERELIIELSERLQLKNNGKISGNIEDVKEALFYYLSSTDTKDTSNWIVRNFEQLDGAVLLKKSKSESYHLCMVSNENMTSQIKGTLPWPLTTEMFFGYSALEGAIPVVTTCILERRNFLRFLLFYGSFFSKKKIKISYIQEENGDEQSLYYLLRILGLKEKMFKEETPTNFMTEEKCSISGNGVNVNTLSKEEKELFSICPYKFMQNRVLKSPIEYSSEFHIKYFVSNFMYFYLRQTRSINDGNLGFIINDEFSRLRRLFPYWGESVFTDIKNETRSQLLKLKKNQGSFKKFDILTESGYKSRKENFLIAQWTNKNGKKMMDFQKVGLTDSINKYLLSSRLYPKVDEAPDHKVCENCNYNDVCLRDYYEARISKGDNYDD